jgi:hypothetical protein
VGQKSERVAVAGPTPPLRSAAGSSDANPQAVDPQRDAAEQPGQLQRHHGAVADRGQITTLRESRYGGVLAEWLVLHASYRLALAAIALGDVAGMLRHSATVAYLRSLGGHELEALDALATHGGYQRGVLDALADQWPEILAGAPGERRRQRKTRSS